MSDSLPQLSKSRDYQQVHNFISSVLTLPGSPSASHLRRLIQYSDGHYRAIFSPAYFVLTEGKTEPSKSQWSTLKKRLKRHDSSVFVFKEYGIVPCDTTTSDGQDSEKTCYYLDFGFFLR